MRWRRTSSPTTVRIGVTAVDDLDQIAFAEAVEHNETTTNATAMSGGYEYLLSSSVSMLELANSMMGPCDGDGRRTRRRPGNKVFGDIGAAPLLQTRWRAK